MPTYHTVKQGEYLASIAALYSISLETIWNDPGNAELKRKRPNPNVLFPGDNIVIPDKVPKVETLATGERHRFRLKKQVITLRMIVRDSDDKPIANTECTLTVESDEYALTTDSEGKIEQDIPATTKQGSLDILDMNIPLKIGHLDPVEGISGQIARLNNLGYDAGDSNSTNEQQFLSAVEEFQCDYGLQIDGDCGKNTQAKLREVHGC